MDRGQGACGGGDGCCLGGKAPLQGAFSQPPGKVRWEVLEGSLLFPGAHIAKLKAQVCCPGLLLNTWVVSPCRDK